MTTVPESFGSLVFDSRVMKARLSADVYHSLKRTIQKGTKLDLSVANAVAAAMKDWAVENGITNGTDATHFSPGSDGTRAQMVTFLWRAAGQPEPVTTVNPFVDVKPTDFYYKAVMWALENGIDTADSMKSRGYGLPGRTAFSVYRFDKRDRQALICLLVLGAAVLAGAAFDGLTWRYFPTIRWSTTPVSILTLCAYLALCAVPIILDRKEDRKWNALRSKI